MYLKKIYLLLGMGMVIFSVFAMTSSGRGIDVKHHPILSLNVRDKALTEVLEDISNRSGYNILIRGEGENIRVSLQLKNIHIEKMLRRVLRDLNYTLIWDEEDKKVLLSLYGSKTGEKRSQKKKGNEDNSPDKFYFQKYTPINEAQEYNQSPSNERYDQRPHVSITGENTRFVQTTSTASP